MREIVRRAAAATTCGDADRAVRRDRRRARLPRRTGGAARRAGLRLSDDADGTVDAGRRPDAARVRRRPGRPRPGHPRRAAPGHGHGRAPGTRCACAATTSRSWCARCAGARSRSRTGSPSRWPSSARRAEEFRARGRGVLRRPGRALRAGRRQARGRARRAAGALPRPRVRPGPQLRAVRRHHRRDRRVRPAGALPVGRATTAATRPSSMDTRRRRSRVGQQHDVPRHRRACSAAS